MSHDELVAGAVYDYTPDPAFPHYRHVREGVALGTLTPTGEVILVDTYWGALDADNHRLNDAELATAKLRFRMDEFELASPHESLEDYDPADVETLTSQRGHRTHHYLRIGAKPAMWKMLDNAEQRVMSARFDFTAAQRELADAQTALVRLSAQAAREEQP